MSKLSHESIEEILQTARSFGNLAFEAYDGDFVIQSSVILFNIHNSLELILKTLHHLKTSNIEKEHTLQRLYHSVVIRDFKNELDECYKETLEQYEQNTEHIDRKITVNQFGNFQEYDKSSLNNTLNTLDNMKLYLQRYSFENNNSYKLLKPIEFIFKLNEALWVLVHKICNDAFKVKGTGIIKMFHTPPREPVLDESGKQKLDERGFPLWKSKVDFLFDGIDDRIAEAIKKPYQDDEGYVIWSLQKGNNKDELDTVIENCNKAIALDSKDADAYYNRGNAYISKYDFDNAIQDYDKVIQLKPDYADAYNNRGGAYAQKGELDRAIQNYDKVIQLKPDYAEVYNNRGEAYGRKGELDRAFKNYDKAIQLKPDFAGTYYNRGLAYGRKNDFDKAIADFNKAITLNPEDAGAYCNLGLIYGRKGELDRAIQNCDKAIQLKPDYADAYNNRGGAYAQKGELDRAIQDYDKAIQLKPNYAGVYNNRGNAYRRTGDFDKAIQDYNTAIDLKLEEAGAYYNRGLAYFNKSDFDKAIQDYNTAIDLNRNYADAYYNRGGAYALKSDFDNAIQDFNKVIALDPEDVQAQLALQRAKLLSRNAREKTR